MSEIITTSTSLAEMEILGAAMSDKKQLAKLTAVMRSDDFADSKARILFDRIKDRCDKGESAALSDMVADCQSQFPWLCSEAYEKGDLLFDLDRKMELVRTMAIKRFAKSAALNVAKEIDADKLLTPTRIAERFADLAKSTIARAPELNSRTIQQLVDSALSLAYKNRKDLIYSGIAPVDDLLKGIERGEYITIAARTSVGKSAFCLNFHVRTGLEGRWSMYVSTEMRSEDVMLRTLAQISGVPLSIIKGENGIQPDVNQSRLLTKAIDLVYKAPMLFYDRLRTIGDIEAELMKQKALGNPIRLLVVDYIGQLQLGRKSTSRQEELSEISRKLLEIAIRENISVISCAQLNRTSDPYGTPDLMQIRDSGSIEQDSTRVLMLTRSQTDPTTTHLHLLKNRNGELGKTEMRFYGSNMRFYSK